MATRTSHGYCAPIAVLDEASDGELLDQFIAAKNEAAFAELVRRHASMVLGVCRRVLHNVHDAEDCFQAVFLVLVRKADTIHPRQMVGNWLYGVAYRTALEARKLAARRRIMERKKPAIVPDDERSRELWHDLGPLLDQELNRLPEKYRAVLVACDLAGKTRAEAARELGLPEGTVASRLARGRALLTKRMTRHSFVMTTTGLTALLLEHAAADVPETLLTATIDAGSLLAAGQSTNGVISRNVAALTDAVVHGFVLANIKLAGAALMILLALGLGVGALLPTAQAERRPGFNNPDTQKGILEPKKAKPKLVSDCIVQKVDHDNQTIEAVASASTSAGDEPARYDLHVGPGTQIRINGQEATLAEVPVSAAVNLEWVGDANGRPLAVRIEVVGKWIDGLVQAVSAESMTVAANDIDKQSFDLDPHAWVVIDGKKTKLGDIKAKMCVKVKVTDGKPRVVGINATGKKVKGAVKSVDAGKKTIALDGVAEAVTVADAAPILIDGKKGTLTELKTGARVTLQMSALDGPGIVVAIRCDNRP